MLYVSFVEIFHESRVYFCCTQPGYYDLLASICFFAGIALAVLLHGLVFVMQKLDCGCTCIRRKTQLRVAPKCADGFAESPGVESGRRDWYLRWIPPIVRGRILSTPCKDRAANANATFASFGGPCSSIEIASGNHASQKVLAEEGQPSEDVKRVSLETSPPGDEVGAALQMIETDSFVVSTEAGEEPVEEDEFHIRGPAEFKEVTDAVVHDRKHLARMGVLTGLAIAIHNFPRRAIAIHNIPEGICVAMPVYYATGSKWKGVFWASLSGFAEPLGALLAYIALKDVFSPLVYGICFGLISGMMVYIALTELLPTAYKFHNSSEAFIPTFLVTGMLVMAASIAVGNGSWNSTYNVSNQNASDLFADCRDPTLCSKPSRTAENVGLAFGLTIGAGLATTLGALLPLVPCVRKSNTKFLAASLGFAAGVMVYVSFTELWQLSRDNFCCHFPRHSELAATIAFFGGVVITVLLNLIGVVDTEGGVRLP
ncbi:hypothetical protein EMCRGX_G023596 [Ephydatia muelleri]